MKDKLWFFTSARYFSVNNFIANTFFDDGSQGIDDQFIKSAMARLTWQVVAAQQDLGLLRRDRQVPRPRHAEQLRSGDGVAAVVLARVSHDQRQMDVAGDQPDVPRGRLLAATSSTTPTATRRASRSRAARRNGSPTRRVIELDLGGRTTAATSQTTAEPERATTC